MTEEQQIEFIRQKCIEANPSIKDLVFGCRIYFPAFPNVWHKVLGASGGSIHYFAYDKYDSHCNESQVEIIGRPIRLADVLLAYKKYREGFAEPASLSINLWNEEIRNKAVLASVRNWDLKNDDLTLQSEETVKFIWELLK